MLEAARHPKIEMITFAEVKEIEGFIGNFEVKIVKKPRYIIESDCTGCGACRDVCPITIPNWFDMGLSGRKVADISFAQAVPTVYQIEFEHCVECFAISINM